MTQNATSSQPDRRARRDEARRTRKAREAAAAAAAARRKRFIRLGAVLAVAAVAVLGAIIVSTGGDDSATTASGGAAPTPVLNLEGIPQDGAVLGDPKAPVRVVEFADMQCPFCKQAAIGQLPKIVNGDVRAGRVKLEFRTLAFLGADSQKAAEFVEAASVQNKLWNVVDSLFVAQGAENSGWVTDDLLNRIGESVPGFDLKKALADRDSATVTEQLDAAKALANDHGVRSTPTFLVGRGDDLKVVDAAGLEAAIKDAVAKA
jgi:protein-disulfide isomerase